MTNMRRGFTMIELIFVIVIIGILAAVAIPKLSATRDDAKISNIIANSRTLVGDLGAFYTAQGQAAWEDVNGTMAAATNVNLLSTTCTDIDTNATAIVGNPVSLCDARDGTPCVTFTGATGGALTVETDSTGTICGGVAADPVLQGLVGTQTFGGSRVVR